MTATVAHIKKEIESLAPDEAKELFRVLQRDYRMAPPGDQNNQTDDEASIEAEWDAEIDVRVKEIAEGKVELISGAEFRRNTDTLFAELGVKRPA